MKKVKKYFYIDRVGCPKENAIFFLSIIKLRYVFLSYQSNRFKIKNNQSLESKQIYELINGQFKIQNLFGIQILNLLLCTIL